MGKKKSKRGLSSRKARPTLISNSAEGFGSDTYSSRSKFRYAASLLSEDIPRGDDSCSSSDAEVGRGSASVDFSVPVEVLSNGSPECRVDDLNSTPISGFDGVPIPKCITQRGVDLWSQAIVGYFVDGKKSFQFATYYANKLWGSKLGKVFVKGNNLFIFTFNLEEDLQLIINSGPLFFGKSPLIFQRWFPGMDLKISQPPSIPIWMHFYNVPLELWHDEGFDFIASQFGKRLRLDNFTMNGHRLSFARICVDVDCSTSIPSSFKVQSENGAIFVIEIVIPWFPSKCSACNAYGHSDSFCMLGKSSLRSEARGRKRKFAWRQKVSPPSSFCPATIFDPSQNSMPISDAPICHSTAVDLEHIADAHASLPQSSARERTISLSTEVVLCDTYTGTDSGGVAGTTCQANIVSDSLAISSDSTDSHLLFTPVLDANKRVLFSPSAEVNEFILTSDDDDVESSSSVSEESMSSDDGIASSYSSDDVDLNIGSMLPGKHTEMINSTNNLWDKVSIARDEAFNSLVSLKPCLKKSKTSA